MSLLEMVTAEARRQYGPGVDIKIDPERGVWLSGLEGEAVAAPTLRALATRFKVSVRPLSASTACSMLGLTKAGNLVRFLKLHGVPCHRSGRRWLVYGHELRRWMADTKFDRHAIRSRSRNRQNGHATPPKPLGRPATHRPGHLDMAERLEAEAHRLEDKARALSIAARHLRGQSTPEGT